MKNLMKYRSQKVLIVLVWGLLGPLGILHSSATAQDYIFGRWDFASAPPNGCGEPGEITKGDFNGDGILDLAIATSCGAGAPGTISILLGRPDGTFEAPVAYAVGAGPSSVAVGDFNGDSKLDLAVANFNCYLIPPCSPGSVSILLGNGDGTFQTHADYGAGNQPNTVRVRDFNGDGKLDLAVVNQNCISGPCSPGSVSILLGNGDGTFRTHVDYPTGTQPGSLAVSDFNGDGKLDLTVANSGDNTVSVLLGKGDGTFQTHIDSATGVSSAFSVVTGDFNRDGKIDLAIADLADNAVSILLGKGDGTFQGQVSYPVGATFGRAPLELVAADFNRDGKLDLAVGNFASSGPFDTSNSSVSILLGKGDGTFPTHAEYETGSFGGRLIAGDFNGDGQMDLARSSVFVGQVTVLLGRGNGTFQLRISNATGSRPKSVAAGDFNGDGKLDLAVANSGANTASVLLGKGNGTFQTHVDYATGSNPVSIATGDFTGGGKRDLAVVNRGSNTVSILLGSGNGTFQAHVDYATGAAPTWVAIGDFNHDGKLDLAVTNSGNNTVSILLGRGDGTFQSHVDYATGRAPSSVGIGDFNGDGKQDLVVTNYGSNIVSVLLGKGDGTFQNHIDTVAFVNLDSVAIGDFNGDGRLDVVAPSFHSTASTAHVLLGNGDGTFQKGPDVPLGAGPVSIIAGDFNGDGKTDVAVAISGENTVSILLAGGNCVLCGGAPSFIADNNPSSITAGDFDGDGSLDLAVTHSGPGVKVLLNYPVIALYPTRLSFGNQRVGTNSAAKTTLLSNPSATASISMNSITIVGANAGDFAKTSTCVSKLVAGKNCTISVTFTPKATGTRTATLIISDNALAGRQAVALTGAGTP